MSATQQPDSRPWWEHEDCPDLSGLPDTYLPDLEARNRANWARWQAAQSAADERDDRDLVDLDPTATEEWEHSRATDYDVEREA